MKRANVPNKHPAVYSPQSENQTVFLKFKHFSNRDKQYYNKIHKMQANKRIHTTLLSTCISENVQTKNSETLNSPPYKHFHALPLLMIDQQTAVVVHPPRGD